MVETPHARTLRATSGQTLVEVLIASALVLVGLTAAAALFTRAVLDVRTGAERSTAAVHAQSGLEGSALPPATGIEYYSAEGRRWLSTPPLPPDRLLWVRETRLRRYSWAALDDGRIERDEVRPSPDPAVGAALGLLEIEVRVARGVGARPLARLERWVWTAD